MLTPSDADSPAVLRQKAADARERGQWNEAVAAAEEATRRDPTSSDGWTERSLALLAVHRDVESLDAAIRAVQCDVAWPSAQRALALARLRRHDTMGAEEAAVACLRARPGYPEGVATLALVRMALGLTEEADRLLRHALALKGTMAEALGNHAALLARIGRDADALDAVDRAIALKPFLPAPHALRGALLRRNSRFAEAAESFATARDADGDAAPELHANLSDALRCAGRLPEALEAAVSGLARHHGHPALLVNLGAALHAAGRTDDALAAYEQALHANPGLAEAENNVGRLHLEAGRPERALDHLRRAFAARPNDLDIARNLGVLLLDCGFPDEAERPAHAMMEADPQSPDGPMLLGRALARQGRGDEAEAAFAAAIRLAPTRADNWFQTGAALLQSGRRAGAVSALRQLCRLAPETARHWALLGQALRGTRFAAADDALRTDLLAAIAHPGAENSHLTDAIASVVLLSTAAAKLRDAATATTPDAAVRTLLNTGALVDLSGDPLTRALLEHCLISNPELERALTVLRRVFLAEADADHGGALEDPHWLPFLCALADQCALNEHVFAETDAETAAVDRLAVRLEMVLAAGARPASARVVLLGAYRPLSRWSGAAALRDYDWPPPVAALLTRQVDEPWAEEALKTIIPSLTPLVDATSAAVRAQYEENPYPRWVQAGLLDAPIPIPAMMRAMFPHATIPVSPQWDAPQVLVAGCGSGREAAWAVNHIRGACVQAVDLSLASLAHAARQSERLELPIAWAQADILALGAALGDHRFDLIQCVGVLHHMTDPLAGWTVLRGLLRPNGLMKIGLYSEQARRPLDAARQFATARGHTASSSGIRRFRQDVLALPDGHPVKVIVHSPDFNSASACRDLVFHTHEHRHTLPQIAEWLDRLGLNFLGFQLENPTIATLYRTRFPQDRTMTDLALWSRFEDEFPHSFGELYQFWVQPKA